MKISIKTMHYLRVNPIDPDSKSIHSYDFRTIVVSSNKFVLFVVDGSWNITNEKGKAPNGFSSGN